MSRKPIDEDLIEKIKYEYENVWEATLPKLAKKYNVSSTSIYKHLKNKGVIFNKVGLKSYKNISKVKGNHGVRWRYRVRKKSLKNLLKAIDYKCEICMKPIDENNVHIDHSHTTHHIRGLLCRTCNTGLGMFYENTETMKNAIVYINKHNPDTLLKKLRYINELKNKGYYLDKQKWGVTV